jgi:hypothetical protein
VSSPLSRTSSASLLLITILAGGAGVLAACGGGGTKAGASATASGAKTAAAYISCLQAHGYNPPANVIQRIENPPTTDANATPGSFPPGGFGGRQGGTTRSTLDQATRQAQQAAYTACQAQAPPGVRVPGTGGGFGGGAQFLSNLRSYISCLNDHGYTSVTVPPTTVANQPPASSQGQSLRQTFQQIQSDPAATSARQACAAIAPTFPGRGATTTTTGG